MGSEQTLPIQQQKQQTVPLINSNNVVKRNFGTVNRDNIILNSISLSIVFIISIYFTYFINSSTNQEFTILSLALYSFYSIPICFFAPIVIAKLRVKYTLCVVMALMFLLYLCTIYSFVGFVRVVSLILTPILTELIFISIGSYLISFSSNLNVGLVFGIFTGIPFIFSNIIVLSTNFQYSNFVIVLFLFGFSIGLLFLLGKSASNDENVEKANGLFTITSVLGCNDFTYFVPAALFIGMIYDYSTINEIGYAPRFLFISGIIGGISAILFGILSDRLCNKSSLLKVILIIGMIGFLLNFILNVSMYRISFNAINGLEASSLTFGAISSSCLIVFIYTTGSIFFKSNSISFVASIRLLQTIGSVITIIYEYWIIKEQLIGKSSIYTTYFSPLVFILSCILLIVLISKRINNHHGAYTQIV